MDLNNNKYFAASDARRTAGDLLRKSRSFYTIAEANGYLLTLKKMWCAYHGINPNSTNLTSHEIKFAGEQGELTYIIVNHFRNLAQHMYTMITASRPTMEAQAINTDYKSLAQATLGNGILQYYMRQKGLENCIKKAVEMAIVLGSSYVKLEWNATAGDQVGFNDETGEFDYSGDIDFSTLSPFDVVFDGTKESFNQEWILVRTYQNKYNLMAKYPELADKIRGLETKSDNSIYRFNMFSNDETDDIPVFEFFHKPSDALPEGRYLLFLTDEIILLDTKMPYRRLPIFRIAPNEIMGTPYGYSPMFDIYPIQEAINSLYTTILSNQQAFGVQNIYIPRGADVTMGSLAGGLNVIEANQKPESLNLTDTPEEIFTFLELMIKTAETLSGVNSVARGAPEASLKSGTALALVQSMALQFISGLQQSYVQLIEDVGTSLMTMLQDFADKPKIVSIVGKNNKPYLREFNQDDISGVSRVIVTMGNPLAKSSAGRIQMAQEMLQMGLLKTPQQYFQILNTGSLDAAYEGETDELLLIKKENERMLDGVVPIVSPLDSHQMHIMEHKAVLSDPDLREDPQLVRIVMDHIQGHMNALRQTDPQLLGLVGQQSLMVPPGMPGAPGMAGQPLPSEAGGSPDGSAPEVMMQAPPAQGTDGQAIGPNGVGVTQPGLPTPPPPFQNLPTNPENM